MSSTHYDILCEEKDEFKENGELALAFARERKSFSDGDRQRIKNQQKVLSAIIEKVTSSTVILTKYASLLNSLQNSFKTNMTKNEISSLVKKQILIIQDLKLENMLNKK